MSTPVNERSPMRQPASQTSENQPSWKWKLMCRIFKIIDSVQSYFVEVALFFFFLARHMTLPLFQEYVQTEIYSQHGLDFLSLTQNANQSHRGEQWNDAHHESVLVVLGLQIAEGLPAIVTVIILGALSDRTGRHRIMLWLPALGSCLYCFIYILIQYTGWSVDGLFLASAFRGLSGSMTAFLAGSSFYAINSVKPHQRTSRLAIQEFLNGGAYAVGNLMVGFWVKDAGFLRPFWFAFICSIIALLISFFLIEETTESAAAEQQQQSPRRNRNSGNCFKDLFQPMAKYFKCWHSSALVKIWLAILAFQTYAFVHIGQENTLVLYLTGQPYLYSWRNSVTGAAPWVKIGLLLSVIMAVAAIATALCTPIFQRFLSDTSIVFIGLASKAAGTLWIAIVHNETLIFFTVLLLAFQLLPFPMLRASVSRGIAPSQQGSLFAMMHCGESITYFLAPFAFSAIYASTLHYYGGLVFIVAFLLLVLPVGFTYGLRHMEKNSPVEYEPMGNGAEPPEVINTPTADQSETAMLPRYVPTEPISFIALNQNQNDNFA